MIIVRKLKIKNLDKRPPQRKKIQNNNAKIMLGFALNGFLIQIPLVLILGNTIYASIITITLSILIVIIIKKNSYMIKNHRITINSFIFIAMVSLIAPYIKILPLIIKIVWLVMCIFITPKIYDKL